MRVPARSALLLGRALRPCLVALLLTGCGGQPLVLDGGSPSESSTRDASVAALDAGSQPWCAAEGVACLADGTDYDAPGRCCISRTRCFKVPGAATGVCDTNLWCANPGESCRANGTESFVPGHCCNGRMTCFPTGCAY